MHFDMPLEQLEAYRPKLAEPDDFDQFWRDTMIESRTQPLNPVFEPVSFGLELVDVFDTEFSGFDGERVKAWLLLPANTDNKKLPCVVEYTGYTGGRNLPYEWLTWPNTGIAHLVMDSRGQGGDTPDLQTEGAPGPLHGYLTRGIHSRETFFYKRLLVDAVRAVEAARSHPNVDTDRVGVAGISQGGGISLAVAGLDPTVSILMSDIPFLCHYQRAATLVDTKPYGELATYLTRRPGHEDRVFEVLSYFDGVNFATRAIAPALFSVGLMDQVCPPSTVYAAYNRYSGPKTINVYPFHQHDAYRASTHSKARVDFMRNHLFGASQNLERQP